MNFRYSSHSIGNESNLTEGDPCASEKYCTWVERFSLHGFGATGHERLFDGLFNRSQQFTIVERFANVGYRSGFEAPLAHARFVMRGNNDGWKTHIGKRTFTLYMVTVQSGHMQVQYQAVVSAGLQGSQEFGTRCENARIDPGRAKQTHQGLTNGRFVIHNGNDGGFSWRHIHLYTSLPRVPKLDLGLMPGADFMSVYGSRLTRRDGALDPSLMVEPLGAAPWHPIASRSCAARTLA
jgi:hypothetical protein